jgi:hypothetical protein
MSMDAAWDRQNLRAVVDRRQRGQRRGRRTMSGRGMGAATTGQEIQSAGTAAAAIAAAAAQGGANPVADITAVTTSVAALIGLGSGSSAFYHSYQPKAAAVVAQYGPDFISGSAALGLNPTAVASALSGYMALGGVNLTPQQLLAAGEATAGTSTNSALSSVTTALSSIPAPYLLGAAGAAGLVLLLLMRR